MGIIAASEMIRQGSPKSLNFECSQHLYAAQNDQRKLELIGNDLVQVVPDLEHTSPPHQWATTTTG